MPDLLAGGVFALLGLAFAIGGSTYDVGTALRMGSGYVPWSSAGSSLSSGCSSRPRRSSAVTSMPGRLADEERGPVPVVAGGVARGRCRVLRCDCPRLGLAPALFVTTFLAALAGHRTDVVRALVTAAGLTVLCLVVFVCASAAEAAAASAPWLGG